MEFVSNMVMRVVNFFRPDSQLKKIRGRWCCISKIRPTVYKVSVIDTNGKFIGTRFIIPTFNFERAVDKAVCSVIKTRATF